MTRERANALCEAYLNALNNSGPFPLNNSKPRAAVEQLRGQCASWDARAIMADIECMVDTMQKFRAKAQLLLG